MRAAATILLLVAATGGKAQNSFICQTPANFVPAPTEKGPIDQNPARTCDLWVSEYNNGILNSEAFNATYNCAGKSSLIVEAITKIVGAGCCGGNSGLARSACFKDRSHICKTAANYLPSAPVTFSGTTQTCDAWVDDIYGNALLNEDFSSAYSCAGKSDNVLQAIAGIAGAGCCAGNSGLAKSACWSDRSHICKTSANYEPFKQVTVSGNTVSCDAVVDLLNNGVIATQVFSSAYTCTGKSADILSAMTAVASLGCCGANGVDACAAATTPAPAPAATTPAPAANTDASSTLATCALTFVASLFAMAVLC